MIRELFAKRQLRWHRWYAWHPIHLRRIDENLYPTPVKWVWLKWTRRRLLYADHGCMSVESDWLWEYQLEIMRVVE